MRKRFLATTRPELTLINLSAYSSQTIQWWWRIQIVVGGVKALIRHRGWTYGFSAAFIGIFSCDAVQSIVLNLILLSFEFRYAGVSTEKSVVLLNTQFVPLWFR